MSIIAGKPTPTDARMMWKPSVNAIWLRAASSWEAARGRRPFIASLARHDRERLLLQIDDRLARDVDDRLLDRAAGERVRRGARVVVRDRLGRVLADVQSLADEREVAGLRHQRPLPHLLVPDVERQRAGGGHALVLLRERRREDHAADRDVDRRLHDLLLDPDEVVDVLQPAVLDVERVAAEARAVREQDAAGLGRLDVDAD